MTSHRTTLTGIAITLMALIGWNLHKVVYEPPTFKDKRSWFYYSFSPFEQANKQRQQPRELYPIFQPSRLYSPENNSEYAAAASRKSALEQCGTPPYADADLTAARFVCALSLAAITYPLIQLGAHSFSKTPLRHTRFPTRSQLPWLAPVKQHHNLSRKPVPLTENSLAQRPSG